MGNVKSGWDGLLVCGKKRASGGLCVFNEGDRPPEAAVCEVRQNRFAASQMLFEKPRQNVWVVGCGIGEI